MKTYLAKLWTWLLILLLAIPPEAIAQQSGSSAAFKPEELEQILATIALYPDPLVSQILMASTYPLEVVQADRWLKQNPKLKGDALTAALEKQDWDPSVKSLINFPQVLTMMNEKLDWTQRLGDAFLEDQKKVLDTIQNLRAKAQAAGNLQSNQEQKVIVEEKIIKIEPANPQVVYVPSYNPTVVYGAWPYPAYPPYAYYPPGYVASSMMWFGAGVAMGAAWGYAWGNCNWNGGDVDIDVDRNTNINRNINRDQAKQKMQQRGQTNQGRWQHNPENRKGVSYRDQATAQKFNRASTNDAIRSREQFRGRAEQGRQELARGGAGDRGGLGGAGGAGNRGGVGGQGGVGDRGGLGGGAGGGQLGGGNRGGAGGLGGGSSNRGGAFQGIGGGGSSARSASSRGSASRGSFSGGGGGRAGGGGRGGGGGGRRR